MPKIVDHEAVRADLTEAALRVLEREGLAAVSVRRVAQEAGVTPGYLRHYFPAQIDLERALTIRTSSGTRDRVVAVLSEHDRPGRDRARAALIELLPLDRRRRMDVQVAYRFVISAADVPGYTGDLELLVDGLRSVTRFAVAEHAGFEHGWKLLEPLPDPELEERAELLAEVVDGISLYGMQRPSIPAAELIARLDGALRRILTPIADPVLTSGAVEP